MRSECPDQTSCLHLVASHGAKPAWGRLDGEFRRFPVGVRKVGQVVREGPLLLTDIDKDAWSARPAWTKSEQIRSFAGQPLVFREETKGVLALFSRERLDREDLEWLRAFADQAAVAIANAQAFDQIEALKDQLQLECDYLREEKRKAFGEVIGASAALRTPMDHVERVAPTDASVLIFGESGTGKELFARAIHERSRRRDKALVKVNCAAIPQGLFESEFFGHAQGAFTGATADRAGRFEVADQGTLFLDEVGELPFDLQSKLLRVLQEGQLERIGETITRTIDVRIISATNRDLEREAKAGRFREDLFYRLSTFPMRLPPLRERSEDIAALSEHFIELAASRFNKPPAKLEPAQLRAMEAYDWPGNIRELKSVIDRAMILADGGRLPLEVALPGLRGAIEPATAAQPPGLGFVTDKEMKQRERDNIIAALEHARWQVSGEGGAAQLLGVKATTLSSRMRALSIERPKK